MAYYMIGLFSLPLLIYLVKTLPKLQSFWFKDIDFVSLISTYAYILVPPSEYIYGFATFYLFIIGIMIYYRAEIDLRVLQFSLFLILPVILMFTISQAIPFYHHRYFIFGGIAFFVLLGWSADILNKKIGKDIDLFVVACWIVFFISGIPQFYSSFDSEIFDSANFLYNHTNNATDYFITIHSSPFSATPYNVYFKNTGMKQAYIITNLTEKELFTAGGSILNYEKQVFNNISQIPENENIFWISDKKLVNGKIIYDKGGIYVTEIER